MGFDDQIGTLINQNAPSVTTADTLLDAMRIMVDQQISALVVKTGDEMAGVVTDLDILASINRGDDLEKTTVTGSMTSCQLISAEPAKSPCVQLDTGQSVHHALALMGKAGFRHLVVVGDNNTPLAVVSDLDLFRQLLV